MRNALLLGGALAGLVIAATDLVRDWTLLEDELPPGAIARVGDRLITQTEFERVAQDLATDKRTQSDEDRRFALRRVIEQELLVQRGIELGISETAPAIRKSLAAAVISQVVAEAEAYQPGEDESRAFYANDSSFFAQSERWQVRWLRTSDLDGYSDPEKQATTCRIEDLRQSKTFEVVADLPQQLLPLAKLMDYMGPTLARQATALLPGECAGPILNNSAYNVLYLEEYQPGEVPAFDDIKDIVEAELIRRRGEQALLDYLDWLRNRAEIRIDDDMRE